MSLQSISLPTIGKVVMPYYDANTNKKKQSFGYIKGEISYGDTGLYNFFNKAIQDAQTAIGGTGIPVDGLTILNAARDKFAAVRAVNSAFVTWLDFLESLTNNNYVENEMHVDYDEIMAGYSTIPTKEVIENG